MQLLYTRVKSSILLHQRLSDHVERVKKLKTEKKMTFLNALIHLGVYYIYFSIFFTYIETLSLPNCIGLECKIICAEKIHVKTHKKYTTD